MILGLDYTCCTVSTLTWLVIVIEHLFRSNECARPATQEKTSQIVAFGVWLFSGFTTGFMAKYASSTKGKDFQKWEFSLYKVLWKLWENFDISKVSTNIENSTMNYCSSQISPEAAVFSNIVWFYVPSLAVSNFWLISYRNARTEKSKSKNRLQNS